MKKAQTDTEHGTLLVVDDNEMNRDMLSRRLSRHGHTVTVAEDGRKALDLIQEQSFDVVLLDIMMPGIDGMEVLKIVREKKSASDLPIIMATAKDESEDVVSALKLGANDYVTKPLDFPVVLARVQTQLSLKKSKEALSAAHARMKNDLEAAARMQHDLLPKALPEITGIEFAWHYEPCDELAGDILNIIPLDDQHIALYILDVCGHGVRSSLLSVAMTHTLSRKMDPSSLITTPGKDDGDYEVTSPALVAKRLNSLYPMFDNGMLFATLGYGVLDTKSNVFSFVCAGHPGPLIVHRDGSADQLVAPGYPIGVPRADSSDEEDEYHDSTVALTAGDRLYLYSDGANEEHNPEREQFGEDRLSAALVKARSKPLKDSIRALVEEIATWKGDADFVDDVTILAAEVQ